MRFLVLLSSGLLGACRPNAATTGPSETESVEDPAAAESTPSTVVMPALRGPYVQRREYEESTDPVIFRRTVWDFEGSTITARFLFAVAPLGGVEQSTTRVCSATVRVPINWTNGGFTVDTDATAEAGSIVLDRAESPESQGQYLIEWGERETTCSVLVREGFYRLENVSDAKVMDRPRTAELARSEVRIELEATDEREGEKELKRAISEHVGRGPSLE